MSSENSVAVSVICIAYNHEKYIEQCLKSVVSQKTNFKFEVIVHDDASTDNTAQIIKKYELQYPEIIKPVYQKKNIYSDPDVDFSRTLISYATGEYITFCETDDYWCNDYKLQKQFDIMENNKNLSVCFHKTATLDEETGVLDNEWIFWKGRRFKGAGLYSQKELLYLNIAPVSAMFYRKENFMFVHNTGLKYGDMVHLLDLALKGEGYCIDEVMSVYRKNVPYSLMTVRNAGVKNYNAGINHGIKIFEYFNEKSNYKFKDIFEELIKEEKKKLISFSLENVSISSNEKILIYGSGVFARVCYAEMLDRGYSIEAFVVTSAKADRYMGLPLISISDIEDKNSKIIIAAGKKARIEIEKSLRESGFKNFKTVIYESEE